MTYGHRIDDPRAPIAGFRHAEALVEVAGSWVRINGDWWSCEGAEVLAAAILAAVGVARREGERA